DFNAHSSAWGYKELNEAGIEVEKHLTLFYVRVVIRS
ncbi:hypothetical protein TNCV_4800381, partial [Trichonephila clavipes]